MANILTPDFKLKIGTTDFSNQPNKRRVSEMTVEQLSDGASSFRIVLDDSDEAISDGKISILEGMECTVEMGFAESGTKQVIKGYVTGVKPKRSEFSRKMFTVTGFDGLSKLTRGRKRRSWENIKDSDIAAQIAQECSLQPDVQDSGLVHPYVVQNNENNLNFLFERARRIGYEVKVEGEKLVFRKPREVKADVTLRWDGTNVRKKGGVLLQRMDFNTSTMNMPKKVVVRSYDPKSGQPIVASASTEDNDKMGGKKTAGDAAEFGNPDTTIQISDQPVVSEEEAERLAKSILSQRAAEFLTGTGKCMGNGKIKCGAKVNIEDVGQEMQGEYYVTSAKHVLRAGHGQGYGYWTEFSVSRTGR